MIFPTAVAGLILVSDLFRRSATDGRRLAVLFERHNGNRTGLRLELRAGLTGRAGISSRNLLDPCEPSVVWGETTGMVGLHSYRRSIPRRCLGPLRGERLLIFSLGEMSATGLAALAPRTARGTWDALPLALAKCPGLCLPFALKISPAASDSPGRPAELFDPPRLAPL
jgi:hypothetical protein